MARTPQPPRACVNPECWVQPNPGPKTKQNGAKTPQKKPYLAGAWWPVEEQDSIERNDLRVDPLVRLPMGAAVQVVVNIAVLSNDAGLSCGFKAATSATIGDLTFTP